MKLLFRESLNFTLWLKDEFSDLTPWLMKVSESEPITEKSAKGFNPCLDWRVEWQLWKLICSSKYRMYCNKNYIVEHKDLWHSFKCVIEKIDNKKHLIVNT